MSEIEQAIERLLTNELCPCVPEDIETANKAIQALQEKAERERYPNGWIPVSERLPEEHDSMFAKFKGSNKWSNAMFEKTSEIVNVTIADVNGKRVTVHAHTIDGKWSCDLLKMNKSYQLIAWQPLPEPYKGERE